MTLPTYPDADEAAAKWLAAQQSIHWWADERAEPPNLLAWLPFVWVRPVGGGISDDTFDRPTCDVEWFASSQDACKALSIAGRSLLVFGLPGYHEPGLTVARVIEQSRPRPMPYDDQKIHRRSGNYSLVIQPH